MRHADLELFSHACTHATFFAGWRPVHLVVDGCPPCTRPVHWAYHDYVTLARRSHRQLDLRFLRCARSSGCGALSAPQHGRDADTDLVGASSPRTPPSGVLSVNAVGLALSMFLRVYRVMITTLPERVLTHPPHAPCPCHLVGSLPSPPYPLPPTARPSRAQPSPTSTVRYSLLAVPTRLTSPSSPPTGFSFQPSRSIGKMLATALCSCATS